MRKFRIYNLRLRSKGKLRLQCTIRIAVFVLTLYILHYTLYIPIYAADASPSASPSANLKTKLEELKKEIASKAAKLKNEVNQRLTNKAYVGNIKSMSNTSITIASINGPKIINVNQDTLYATSLKSKKKFTFGTLKEDDYIAALGDIDETGILTAKKLILLPTNNSQLPIILWGQIHSMSNSQIAIKDRSLKNHILIVSSETIYQKGTEEITSEDIKLNNFIITSGIANSNGTIKPKFIYVIPTGGILKLKKTATPSATPSTQATSSGKKKN